MKYSLFSLFATTAVASIFIDPSAVTHAFVAPSTAAPSAAARESAFSTFPVASTTSRAGSTSSTLFMAFDKLALSLEKPLGLILEENDNSNPAFGAGGVIVTQVNEGGSAFGSPYKSQLVQSKIYSVMGKDVSSLSFDDVMDEIIGAPSPFNIEFALSEAAAAEIKSEGNGAADIVKGYEVGATVTIKVEQPESNKPDVVLTAQVGDNLRKTLLANGDVELYRGMKKKLGNCGGGGQCGFCAVELIDDEGVWGQRSDYEAQKIGKNGNEKTRLACMNNIVGPATVRTL